MGGSLKQARLHFGICGFLKIAQADSNQAKTLPWTKVHFLSQVKSDFRQFLASGGRRRRSMAAGEDLELAGLELKNYCPCDASFFARSGPDLFRKAADHRPGFGDGYVVLERVLGGDGFGGPVGNH